MLETSADNMVDGENKRVGYRKHQTRMDTEVGGDEGCVKVVLRLRMTYLGHLRAIAPTGMIN